MGNHPSDAFAISDSDLPEMEWTIPLKLPKRLTQSVKTLRKKEIFFVPHFMLNIREIEDSEEDQNWLEIADIEVNIKILKKRNGNPLMVERHAIVTREDINCDDCGIVFSHDHEDIFQKVMLNYESEFSKFPIRRYTYQLLPILQKTTKLLEIKRFQIDTDCIECILESANQVRKIVFDLCLIHSQGMRLDKDLNFRVENLKLIEIGHPSATNWRSNMEDFQGLMYALYNSKLKSSIEILDICEDEELSLLICKELTPYQDLPITITQRLHED
ncbi:unnamed protein product [Moneuplotes crassus]|uniref:Uncharacterized protein n=1 Tax=Euplotes crassus TaxID=5936 RepID=A0AAD2D349_EUPCR|nr:unnamed protein product [Moneuplotes crassus]